MSRTKHEAGPLIRRENSRSRWRMAVGPPREELAKRSHLQQQACSKYRVDSSRQCPSLRATTAVSLSIKVGCLRAIRHPEGIAFHFAVEHVRVLAQAARETHC